MPQQEHPRLVELFESCRLLYRNFSGAENRFNVGKDVDNRRDFNIVLENPEQIERMVANGWNVRFPDPRDDDEEGMVRNPLLRVAVGYKVKPPTVIAITAVSRTSFTKENIGNVDWLDILNCDCQVTANWYETPARQGYKAWLDKMYLTVQHDYLEEKYSVRQPIEGG